jgi:hypothetical protein
MPFLSINGITVPVEDASASRSISKKGSLSPSVSGILRNGTRALHRSWDLTICFSDYDEGKAFINLLEGNGHFWDFADGVEASTGLQPVAYPPMAIMPNIWGLNGRGVAHVDAFQSVIFQGHFKVNPSFEATNWTILWNEAIGSGWKRAAKRSDGIGFFEGSRDDNVGESGGTTWNRINVFDGNVVMYAQQASGTMGLEDVLMLPWHVPNSWLEVWTSNPGPKLPSMPFLTATGDFISEPFGTAYVVGEITDVGYTQLSRNGTWINNALRISATIHEVDPYYVSSTTRQETTPALPIETQPVHHFDGSDFDGFGNATYYNGQTLTGWRNKGSSGVDAVQAGSAPFPVYQPYSLGPNLYSPSGVWNPLGGSGSGKLQATSLTNYSTRKTVVFIFRDLDSGTATKYGLDGSDSSRRTIFQVNTVIRPYSGGFLTPSPAISLDARQWGYAVMDFKATASSRFYFNGELKATGSMGTQGLGGLALGGLWGTSTSFYGQIAEVIAWAGDFTDNSITIEDINNYVRIKHEGLF